MITPSDWEYASSEDGYQYDVYSTDEDSHLSSSYGWSESDMNSEELDDVIRGAPSRRRPIIIEDSDSVVELDDSEDDTNDALLPEEESNDSNDLNEIDANANVGDVDVAQDNDSNQGIQSTSTAANKRKNSSEIVPSQKKPKCDSQGGDDSDSCPVCFDQWTSNGSHRLCSLR